MATKLIQTGHQSQLFSACSTKATSDTSAMPCNNSNSMKSNTPTTNSNSTAMTNCTVSLHQHKDALARLDVEVRARQRAESQLSDARSRIQFLERQLATLSPGSNQHYHLHKHQVVVNPSAALMNVCNTMVDSCNSNIPQNPQQTHQRNGAQSPHQSTPQQNSSPSAQQHQAQMSHPPQSQQSQEKEILSHCSDISNCNKVTSNNGNGSAGGGSCNSHNTNNNQTAHSASKKTTNPILNASNGITKKSKAKKERPAKVKIPGQSRYWTPEEHKLFLEALQKYGHKDLRSISSYVGTRNMTQVRTHSQKYFMRLMREAKRQNPGCKTTTDTNDSNMNKTINSQKPQICDTNIRNITASSNNNNNSALQPNSENLTNNNKNNLSRANGIDESDKYSVPNTCGMTLLCLVGEDTRV